MGGAVWAALLAFFLPLVPAAAEECPGGEIADLGALSARMAEFPELTVLSIELLVSPTRSCRETWVVEVLNEDGEVLALLFNARTLEDRMVGRIDEPEEEQDDEDREIFPIKSRLVGREMSELIEGYWSDDRMIGGLGRDLFIVTPGTDIIEDFTLGEDVLDVGDFARSEDGFGVLRSMDDVRRMSTEVVVDGRRGTSIDIDGGAGDW
ncbi:MAG: hypothetical protein AAFQ75_05110, partial [Pseudomonadota bacterium]